MPESVKFDIPMPTGFRIYERDIEIAGTGYRKKETLQAFNKPALFVCEPEPDNPHGSEAIKILAVQKRWFWQKALHIGYVPKEVAVALHMEGLHHQAMPRPRTLWIGDSGSIRVYIDILVPKH